MTDNTGTTSSDNGLICAYLLDGNGGAKHLTWDEIEHATGLRWIHLDMTHPNSYDWLMDQSGLDGYVVEALLAEESRPRTFENENGVFTVLRGVNLNPGSEVEDMVAIRMWMEEGRIISTRRRRLMSVTDIRSALEEGSGPVSPGDFLVSLAEGLGDRIGETVDSIETALDHAEDQTSGTDLPGYRAQLSALRRKTARMRRYLSPQREALDRLSRSRSPVFEPETATLMHEQANRMTHFIEDLDLARERGLVAQEESLSLVAHEQNSRMLLLSIIAAIFLPLAFFTGLMGMNVAGLPGLEYPLAFWVVLALMFAAAGGILGYFKWKNWL